MPLKAANSTGPQNLRERVVQDAFVTATKRAQSPVAHPFPGSQITKRQILQQAPFHQARARDALRVRV